ncbi:MAG: CPBP family intramembrane metalloprotease [Bradyrhizobiaceae bacterium]|nr:CPBP family intramembrane metalloprotease [Bradyrhizobiaceae bacterium]
MKSFGIAATLGFAVVALLFGQAVGLQAAFAAVRPASSIAYDGAAVAVYLLVGTPVQVVTLALAARMTGEDLLAYFGLNIPQRRDLAVAVGALAVLIVAGDALTFASGGELVPSFQTELHRTALAEGALLPLWIAMIVVGPVGEEILFRGFLFRGFIHEPQNALPGILAISLIWALLHQYDWVGTTILFALGVFLGFVRLISGSTTLVIVLHMLWNLESVIETVIALGWV